VRTARLRQEFHVAAACLLGLAVLSPQPALASPRSWPVQDPVGHFTSAQELEAGIDHLRKSIWDVYSRDYTDEPDIRGRSLKQDIDEWLLPPASSARLEALQAKARAQEGSHQDAALRKTLDEAAALLQREVYREDLINDYWFYQTRLVEHKKLFAQLESRLPLQARTGAPGEVTAAVADAGRQFGAALAAANPTPPEQQASATTLAAAIDAEFVAYNEQRTKLAAKVGAAEHSDGVAPLQLTRTAPCPAASGKTSGKPKPTLDPGTQRPVELDYPEAMRQAEVEGMVVVKVSVSFAGCAVQAQVNRSSGAPELDQAALHWVLMAQFLPGEQDHQAVAGDMYLGVRFKTN
jgi:TonB family protein